LYLLQLTLLEQASVAVAIQCQKYNGLIQLTCIKLMRCVIGSYENKSKL
jgi:hypothetical protein